MIGNIRNDFFKLTLTPPTPTTFLNPYACGTQGYKGCYLLYWFFVLFLSQLFFSVVVFLFVYRDDKDVFSLFPFFFLFMLFFFLHAFFLSRSIRENWSKINIVWIDIMHIWVKEFVVRLMMLLLFLYKALILGKI